MKRRKMPNVVLIDRLPAELKADITRRGLFRCHILVPDCTAKVYCQLYRKSQGIFSLFCLKHALKFAAIENVILPLPGDN